MEFDKSKYYEVGLKIIIVGLAIGVVFGLFGIFSNKAVNPTKTILSVIIGIATIYGLLKRINFFRILLMIIMGLKLVFLPIGLIFIFLAPEEIRLKFFSSATQSFLFPINNTGLIALFAIDYCYRVWAFMVLKSHYVKEKFKKVPPVAS